MVQKQVNKKTLLGLHSVNVNAKIIFVIDLQLLQTLLKHRVYKACKVIRKFRKVRLCNQIC